MQQISGPFSVGKLQYVYSRHAWSRYVIESTVAGRVSLDHHGRGIELQQMPGNTPPDDKATMGLRRVSQSTEGEGGPYGPSDRGRDRHSWARIATDYVCVLSQA